MEHTIPGTRRTALRRWAPWLLGAGGLAVAGGVLHALPGAGPDPGHWVCERTVFGPLATGFVRATAGGEPWPRDLPSLLSAAGYGEPLPAGALRCPDDAGREGRDPLADPSVVLVPGLRADMPPATIALYERAAFHSPLLHVSDGRRVPGVGLHLATIGGTVDLARDAIGAEGDGEARRAVLQEVERAVAADRCGLDIAGRVRDVAASDSPVREAARQAVRRGLADPEPRVRAFAAWTAAESRDASFVPSLRAALSGSRDDRTPSAREEAARALALLGDRSGDKVLVQALDAEDRDGPWGDPAPGLARRSRAIEALRKLEGDDDKGYRAFEPPWRREAALARWRAWAAAK